MPTNDLRNQLARAMTGLYLPSATAPLTILVWSARTPHTPEALRARLILDDHVPTTVMSSADFFAPLATPQRGMDAVAEQRAQQFAALATLLDAWLSDVTVTRIGRITIAVFILGVASDGRIVGLCTTVIAPTPWA